MPVTDQEPITDRSMVLNGIEEDILEELNLEVLPPALYVRIQNRLYDRERTMKRQARAAVKGAMDELLARVLA